MIVVTGSSGHVGDFSSVIARLRDGGDIRSPLARAIGEKGYH